MRTNIYDNLEIKSEIICRKLIKSYTQEVEIENKNGEKMLSGGEGGFSNDKSKSMDDVTGLGCSSNKTLRLDLGC